LGCRRRGLRGGRREAGRCHEKRERHTREPAAEGIDIAKKASQVLRLSQR
jgi:hypothetical protein